MEILQRTLIQVLNLRKKTLKTEQRKAEKKAQMKISTDKIRQILRGLNA